MEERIISGYCRCLDQSRMVTVEIEPPAAAEIDCSYGNCIYEDRCPIAAEIRSFLDSI